jgi:dGTPase
MNWTNIVSTQRTGEESANAYLRTQFERDFDRLIFSSGFRRLQNKTQVFPLPGATFVHNRLTHSLEVASVGRSLGKLAGNTIADTNALDDDMNNFYRYELSSVIAAACLAHDIGNPAFGHSGEKAISNYFKENAETNIDGQPLKNFFSETEWSDLTNFEGNANALRVLTHHFAGKTSGGMRLTYTTLAAILKYPCESIASKKGIKHRSKYGFFQTEKTLVKNICQSLNMICESETPLIYKRHPFVYLTEAADDICYSIIDMEDAQRLKIISAETAEKYFLNVLEELGEGFVKLDRINNTLAEIYDRNERIAYLRANCINVLTQQTAKVFAVESKNILNGSFNGSLIDHLYAQTESLNAIEKISVAEIYNHETVIEIELAGYNVMSDLLKLFIPAALKQQAKGRDEKILRLIPKQFSVATAPTAYEKAIAVLDYVSGMTDLYATELYKKVMGVEIPKHR